MWNFRHCRHAYTLSSNCSGAVLLCAVLAHCALPAAAQESAEDIVRRAEERMRGQTAQGSYRLTNVRPGWERVLEFDSWAEGTERLFIRIQAPARERGVTFLKLGREMWQFVPRISRVIKMPPSMMMQSWMGSGFTNDDLVRGSSLADDYTATMQGIEPTDQGEAWKISLHTLPHATVAWERVDFWVRRSDYVPVRAEYFNARQERVRTLVYDDFATIGGRTLPKRITLVEDRHPDRRTVLEFVTITFDAPIRASVFTQSNLRRTN